MIILGVLLLTFSLYTLFIAGDALDFAGAVLRVSLSILGIVGARFSEESVISTAVFLFAILAVAQLAISRGEVQIDHDES